MTRPATPSFAASACSAGQSAGHQRSIAAFSALRLLPALLLSAFAAAPVAAQDGTFQLGTVVVSGKVAALPSMETTGMTKAPADEMKTSAASSALPAA